MSKIYYSCKREWFKQTSLVNYSCYGIIVYKSRKNLARLCECSRYDLKSCFILCGFILLAAPKFICFTLNMFNISFKLCGAECIAKAIMLSIFPKISLHCGGRIQCYCWVAVMWRGRTRVPDFVGFLKCLDMNWYMINLTWYWLWLV